jgi:hypothetical protein
MMTHPAAGCERLTDVDLIERSLRQPGCFGEIFDRHSGGILRYMYARLGPDRPRTPPPRRSWPPSAAGSGRTPRALRSGPS